MQLWSKSNRIQNGVARPHFLEEEWNALIIQDAQKEGVLLVCGLSFGMQDHVVISFE